MIKKFISGTLSAIMLVSSMGINSVPYAVNAVDAPNYAEALQKSLYFYECQQAGPLPEWNRVEWRADSTMIDEVKGGWYDAGDHVKFNLPMAYSASMLAWGLYQYPEGIEKCGEMTNYVNNLEFVLDYLAECDRGDEAVFQVGSGQIDHTWWGAVELYQYGMEDSGTSYESAREILVGSDGCSAVFGGMAAALASGYCALKDKVDSKKLDEYIKHAENLFKLADDSKSDEYYNNTDAMGFYRSSHFYDELFYAANWLYIATGEKSYLDKATGYIPNLSKELGTDELCYSWSHCWDDTMQGGMLLYAINTNDDFYISRVEKHLDYLANKVEKVDGKLAYISNWGCARYAQTSAFITAVACDTVLKGKNTGTYESFYEDQINYVLGDNPTGQSYVVGYGEKPAHNAHHRTAHASWKNDIYMPEQNRHTLYGALVGGPTQDGAYEDDRNNYINNEVATDYNAGFTAILCKMIDKYGGKSDPSFPPKEEHDSPEFFVEALDKGVSASGATISFKVTNHSAWPARVQDNISFRYYMDLSEIIDAGKSPEDVVVRCDRDQSAMYSGKGVKSAEISGIKHYKDNIYYVEVNLPDGRAVLPVSEGMQQCEILLAFVFPDYGSGWDAENDFSNKEIIGKSGEEDEDGKIKGTMTKYIPVYINGELYYGEEPDGTSADGNTSGSATTKPIQTTTSATTTITTTTASDKLLIGDANCDSEVNIADATAIIQHLGNKDKYGLSEQGLINADCCNVGDGVTGLDALALQKLEAKSISSLPITE
ncbi:MAG: glycoside hydrolase family 9 protein [Ruminococcus sp.]|nr:glycoside hydrolase family 9 protein [Ruminococcus sp.]MDE7098094.1 glycoside hydrolase family 9 protein [Ruminococcus sp.]